MKFAFSISALMLVASFAAQAEETVPTRILFYKFPDAPGKYFVAPMLVQDVAGEKYLSTTSCNLPDDDQLPDTNAALRDYFLKNCNPTSFGNPGNDTLQNHKLYFDPKNERLIYLGNALGLGTFGDQTGAHTNSPFQLSSTLLIDFKSQDTAQIAYTYQAVPSTESTVQVSTERLTLTRLGETTLQLPKAGIKAEIIR